MKQQLNKGFTLLEVMISVFVLAIGLLGIAGLQMTGIKNNHTANMRVQATQLSYNLADRIRANIEGLENGGYLANVPDPLFLSDCSTAFPAGNTCTPTEMAQADINYWFDSASNALPLVTGAGNTEITCSTLPCLQGSIVTIQLRWNEQDGANGLTPITFSMGFQP